MITLRLLVLAALLATTARADEPYRLIPAELAALAAEAGYKGGTSGFTLADSAALPAPPNCSPA